MEQTKLEQAIEVIGQATYEALPPEDPENDEIRGNITSLLNLVRDGYSLVQWPDSQEYMEEEWFDEEAILALGSEDKTGGSAYFITINRLL